MDTWFGGNNLFCDGNCLEVRKDATTEDRSRLFSITASLNYGDNKLVNCNEKYLEARNHIATKCLPRLLGIFAMGYTESNLAKV